MVIYGARLLVRPTRDAECDANNLDKPQPSSHCHMDERDLLESWLEDNLHSNYSVQRVLYSVVIGERDMTRTGSFSASPPPTR